MALNDFLKCMPSIDNVFSNYEPSAELEFTNLKEYKSLAAPPYSNVRIINAISLSIY